MEITRARNMATDFDNELVMRIICREIIYTILICQLPRFKRENLFHLVVIGCLILMVQMDQFGAYLSVLWGIHFWNTLVKNAFVRYGRHSDFGNLSVGMFVNSNYAIPRFLNAVNEMLPPNFNIIPANNNINYELQQLLASKLSHSHSHP